MENSANITTEPAPPSSSPPSCLDRDHSNQSVANWSELSLNQKWSVFETWSQTHNVEAKVGFGRAKTTITLVRPTSGIIVAAGEAITLGWALLKACNNYCKKQGLEQFIAPNEMQIRIGALAREFEHVAESLHGMVKLDGHGSYESWEDEATARQSEAYHDCAVRVRTLLQEVSL